MSRYYMLKLTGGPYADETRIRRDAMTKDQAQRAASDARRRIGCRVSIVPYQPCDHGGT